MNSRPLYPILPLCLFALCALSLHGQEREGSVFEGVSIAQGKVSAGPTLSGRVSGQGEGYTQGGDSIVGFTQMLLSQEGGERLEVLSLMPTLQEVELSREGLATSFSHDREQRGRGYYSVVLDRGNIKAEITVTQSVALHRFTFPRGSNNARVVIDLSSGTGDSLALTLIHQLDDYTLAGLRMSPMEEGKEGKEGVYFCMRFSRPIHHFLPPMPGTPYAQATFEVGPGQAVMAKVSLSREGEAQALMIMDEEMPGWDFEAIRGGA